MQYKRARASFGRHQTCRSEDIAATPADPRRPSILSLSIGATAVATLLAGCSAHERAQTAATTTPAAPQQVALTTTVDTQAPGAVVPAGTTTAATATVATAPATSAAATKPATARTAGAQPAGSATKVGRSGAGLASWYGGRFHGRSTANGERFDKSAFTAAHRSFPLPSYVRVTNVTNGRSMVVRVNDRGPFHGNRVIDVSHRAADVLGFTRSGVGNVKLDYLGPAPESGSDDRKLLASYQEFGRPGVAPGAQVAGLAPVTDAQLAAEAGSGSTGGGAFAIASAAVNYSTSAVVSTAKAAASGVSAAATGARTAATSAATAAADTVRAALPKARPAATPSAAPVAVAYAPQQPAIGGAPAAIVDADASHAKRTIVPSAPALASATPVSGELRGSYDVSSRISAGFDSFGSTSTQAAMGGSTGLDLSR